MCKEKRAGDVRTEVGRKIRTSFFLCKMDRLLKQRERLEKQGEDNNRLNLKIKNSSREKGTEMNMGQKNIEFKINISLTT